MRRMYNYYVVFTAQMPFRIYRVPLGELHAPAANVCSYYMGKSKVGIYRWSKPGPYDAAIGHVFTQERTARRMMRYLADMERR